MPNAKSSAFRARKTQNRENENQGIERWNRKEYPRIERQLAW